MKSFRVISSLAMCMLTVSPLPNACAQSPIKQGIPYYKPTGKWMSDAWTDSDKPFLQAERDVEKRIVGKDIKAKRTAAGAAVDLYRKLAMKDLSNSTRVYQWAYATQQFTQIAPDYIEKEDKWLAERDALSGMMRSLSPGSYVRDSLAPGLGKLKAQGKLPKPVRSYSYLRMFYITATNVDFARSGEYAQDFAQLGTRLLRRNPDDRVVKALQSRLLGYSWREKGKRRELDPFKSLSLARELVKDYPADPYYLILLASAQRRNWNYRQNDNGADLALTTYKRYLAAEPSIPSYQGYAKASIASIEKSKKFWHKRRQK